MPKYDNSERLSTVSDQDWREALDELTAYLKWRLKGRTKWGAHSEKVLETPALDYYTEEAVAKLIEGFWKWQDRYTLAEQLIQIAGNLITKNAEKYKREHPWVKDPENIEKREKDENSDDLEFENWRIGGYRKSQQFVSLDTMDPEDYPEVIDVDEEEEMDETYEMVMRLVSDDKELTVYVEAIRACGHFEEIPEYMNVSVKRVYRLQEKLVRRMRKLRVKSEELRVEDSDEGKKRMRFIDKVYMFEAESKSAEENYRAFGTTREEHQKKMLEFIHKKLEEVKGERKK